MMSLPQGVLVVLDGGKALRAAVDAVFGPVPVQRCVRHKERNVLDHLPERDRPTVKRKLRTAWKLGDHQAAIERLEALAGELAHSHPGAAASLREGLTETVTLQRLRIDEQLWRTLSSTNPIESMIGICRATSRNVKRWQNGGLPRPWRDPLGADKVDVVDLTVPTADVEMGGLGPDLGSDLFDRQAALLGQLAPQGSDSCLSGLQPSSWVGPEPFLELKAVPMEAHQQDVIVGV